MTAGQLRVPAGWTVIPLEDSAPRIQKVGVYRLPHRFGGQWRHHNEDTEGEPQPTGREVTVWFRVVDNRVELAEVTYRGFGDAEIKRLGVPPWMRDELETMFSVFGGRVPDSPAAAVRAASPAERDEALRELRRRRRSNAISHERIAELYQEGGARRIMEAEEVSEATAYRWVKAARKAGVLDERRQP